MTEGRSCASCGAQNEPAAPFCWQCYARFSAGAPATVPAAVAAPALVGGGPPAPTAQASLSLPPWQQASPYASSNSLPEPIPERRSAGRRIVPFLLVVAVGIGGFVGWRTFLRDPFPPSIGGFARLDGRPAEQFEEAVKQAGKDVGVSMRGAAYGKASEMALMAIVTERTEATGGLDAALLEPLPMDDPRLPGTRYEEAHREGASFRCFSFAAELAGTGCFWLDPETAGFVVAVDTAAASGMELAAAVRRAVT